MREAEFTLIEPGFLQVERRWVATAVNAVDDCAKALGFKNNAYYFNAMRAEGPAFLDRFEALLEPTDGTAEGAS